MKIAVIVGRFPVLSEIFIINQIVGLIERGHEVDIYTLDSQSLENNLMHPEVEKYHLLERTYCLLSVPKNPYFRLLKGLWLLLKNFHKDPLVLVRSLNFKYGKEATSFRLLYQVIPSLGKGPYDIIHCQFGTLGQRIIKLRHLGVFQGKLITSFRGFDLSQYIQKYGEDVYKELFSTADFFLPNCEYFQHRLIQFGCDAKKIAVHRSGINCDKFIFSPRLPTDGCIRIAMTGRLVEKKGTEYSIRAVAQLAKIQPNIEFMIIGDGPLQAELKQLIHSLKIEHIVKIYGSKSHQEIIEIFKKTHLFIAPSVTAKDGDQEGIPNVLKEAMCLGLPVVSTDHSGIPELVENGVSGFLVPERDPEALYQKLFYLIKHPEIWETMGRAGRAYVEKYYNSAKLNEQLIEIYQQVLATKDEI